MSFPLLPLLLLLVCVTTTRGAAKSDTAITCEAGVCTFGTRTSVTCYFNEDISASRHAFSVDLYPFNASRDDIGQTVFACKWPKSGTKPDCYVRNGFRFNYIVTDRLTLEIPVATEEVSGQYACALVPLEHRRAKRCTLIVDVPGNETSKKDSRGQELQINQTDNSHGGYADLIRVNFGLNVVILVLFVVVGIVVAVVLIRKRRGRLYLIMCSIFHGEKAGDEKQEKPNGSIDGKQQTTQSPDVCVGMEPTTPMLNGYSTPISRRCSDSGNSSDEPNDVSHA